MTMRYEEKIDLVLAISGAFAAKFGDVRDSSEIVGESDGFPDELRDDLIVRAGQIGLFDENSRERWRLSKLDRLRRRGRSARFDENVHPTQIVDVLMREPRSVQRLIIKNLPDDLARRLATYLDISLNVKETSRNSIDPAIVTIVRTMFLRNFVTVEELVDPDAVDRFSIAEFDEFVRHLGLREIAIACRGIGAKETLAAFLNRFSAVDAKEIARYLTELDKIRPFWVAQADALVRKSWNAEIGPEKVVRKIGLRLLAGFFVQRSAGQMGYASQKLASRETKNWDRQIRIGRRKYDAADGSERVRLDKRNKIIERLALKFVETGRL